jgi:retron-type reverse transcriptase
MNARTQFPLRGGNWNNGSNAGLGALNFNNSRSNSNNNIGFRPALDNARSTNFKELCQCENEKDAITSAIAEKTTATIDESNSCIFTEIYSFENILTAAYQCRKGKTKNASTLQFFNNLEENIIQLQNELIWNMYKMSPYRHFYVFEPKRRLISAPHFRDRVIHRAIHNIIEPMIDRQFIFDSYACRKNKGTHAGADKAQKIIKKVEKSNGKAYALKADISKYFSSIEHEKLKELITLKVKCPKTLKLLFYIIENSPCDKDGVGIPLGNLTSQLFANIYLNELDRFVKHKLKAKNYIRYMDDFVIVHNSKSQLHEWRKQIEKFINQKLKLKTNNKTQIFPIAKSNGRALDFLGYRIYSSHKLLRKSSVKRIKSKLKKFRKQFKNGDISLKEINQGIQSWLGHASHANTHKLKSKILNTMFTRGNE